jgi:CubicO group peptidase (beta-lactamase class C family)
MEDVIVRKSEKCGHAILIAVCSLISVSCLTDDPLKIPFQSFSPLNLDDGWEIAKPDEVGIDEEALKDVYRYIHKDDAIWQIRSLLVIRNGKLVAESYMKNSNDRTNLHAIWSNTKQVVGILAGIAVDRGLISLNDTIADHLPEVSKHPEKSQITIENLLMMKSGVNYDNDGYKGQDAVLSREEPSNSIDYVLGLGMHSSPGAQFRYKNSDPHILSAIIQERAGKTLRDWAQDVLFDEIGIRRLTWLVYKDSVTMGGYGIKTTPREMGKIGQLVLNDGMWEGKQIVSSSWINEMTSSKVPAHETQNANITFGYLWWKDTERNVNFMWGHGGQFVLTNKDKNIVVVITAEQHTSGDFNLSAYEAFSLYDRINSITK